MKAHGLHLAAAGVGAALVSIVLSGAAWAAYPERAVTMIVPYNPGGATDMVARLVADALSAELGQPVVVENRAGAGSQVGLSYVANSKADGYTILFGTADGLAVLPAVKQKLPYDPIESFQQIGLIAQVPFTYTVRKDFPAEDFAGFVAWAKENPEGVIYGSSGQGTTAHIYTELMAAETGIKLTHVPYTGTGPVIADMLGGNIDLTTATPSAVEQYERSEDLKVLAVAGDARHTLLPEVPTTAELGYPAIEASSWFGVLAPSDTAPEVVERLRAGLKNVAEGDGQLRENVETIGARLDYRPADEFRELITNDIARLKTVAERAQIELKD